MDKLIIQVRVNEGVMRDVSPNVPYSPEEIAQQSIECWRRGASIVHYHARDPATGAKSSDVALYADVVRRIKAECDIVTFPTLGAAMLPTVDERFAHVREMAKDPATKPDCIPVDMLTTNLDSFDTSRREISGDRIYLNTVDMLRYLCVSAREVDVKPVAMIWNVAGLRLTQAFVEMGLFEDPLLCEFPLFGEAALGLGHPATLRGLQSLLDFLPAGSNWHWLAKVGDANAFPVMGAAIALGGHVTVGVPDYPYPELGFPSNADLVTRVVEMAHTMGREIATAAETRDLLGLA